VIPASENGKGKVYESPGGQLWTAVSTGLEEYQNGAWVAHPIAEIALEFRSGVPRIVNPVPLYPSRQGQVLFLLSGGLMQYSFDGPGPSRTRLMKNAAQSGLTRFSAMVPARDGGLWVAGSGGAAKVSGPLRNLQPDTEWTLRLADQSFGTLQDPQESGAGVLIALAPGANAAQKRIVQFDGAQWTVQAETVQKLRQAWRGPDGNGWAMTITSLLQWGEEGRLTETEELGARQYFDVAVEPGGAFWLATSDGLFRFAPLTWSTPADATTQNVPVHCLAEDAAGRIWFLAGSVLHSLQEGKLAKFPISARGQALPPARRLVPLKNGAVLVAFEDPESNADLLLQFDPLSARFKEPGGDGNQRFKLLGVSSDYTACLQKILPKNVPGTLQLQSYDGTQFRPLIAPESSGLGTNLSSFFASRRGEIWLSGDNGTGLYQGQKWRYFPASDKDAPASAIGFAELADGKLFCATHDEIWEFDGRNWSSVRRGLDRINGLLGTREGSLWVASNSGLHRYYQAAWLENGTEEGLPSSAVRQIIEDRRGRFWAATTRGLSRHHPDADADPPQSTLAYYPGQDGRVEQGTPVTVSFSGKDKWKHTPRERLLYSYRLDESDWSPFQETSSVQLPELTGGKHFVQVRAMDRSGNIEPKPAQLALHVLVPWYKETRLVMIAFAGLAGALFFAGVAFNRHRQLLRSYAEVERKVAERSRQLEAASLELMQSQKMNALGTLAAGIAHDFNNILSIIKGSAQLIEDNLHRPEKVRTRLDRINTVVEQGAGIVKAMLGFCRENDQPAGACPVADVINDTLRLLGDRFLREIQVCYEPVQELPPIHVPRAFIQQIL
ncbi:MAG TPA: two-component regulator propeller domain-containing protein, partial [Clostridia bacterium]|nr:two-component regulator propeller domain-containing protein [Clostridia bacterium]